LHVVEALTNGTATIAASTPAANGHANGHANGLANGHAHANGNGHANGYANGHYANGFHNANGHANGVLSRLDVTRLAAAASVVGVAAPAYVASAPALQHAAPATFAPGGIYSQIGKRLLDIVGASVALVCFSPVIALAALAVKLDSRGAALYKSKRLGKDGREFTFYKLRSMHVGAEAERARLMHSTRSTAPCSSCAATRASPASASGCARRRSTSCRRSSTCSRAT
jgi:hypothetical protein